MASITRADAADLFAETFQREVVAEVTKRSVAMSTFRTINMGTATYTMPVLDTLPTAGFLSAPQDVKSQTTISWDNLSLTAEEIAVIVPIDETVLQDATIDVWAEVRDLLAQEFGRVIDAAVFFGTGAPATFPTGGIHGVAYTAGQLVEYDPDDPLQVWSDLFSAVEDPGGDVNTMWAGRKTRGLLRTTRDSNGYPIPEVNTGGVFGIAPTFPLGWDSDLSHAIVGDRTYAILGVRQDMQFKFSDSATLTAFGNLFEKDTIALRATMRVACTLANPLRLETGAREYPFATLSPEGGAQS